MEAPWACESFGIVLVFIFEGLVMADHYPIPTLDFHCFHSLSIHLPTQKTSLSYSGYSIVLAQLLLVIYIFSPGLVQWSTSSKFSPGPVDLMPALSVFPMI